MTKVSLNAEKLETAIAQIREVATDAEGARTSINFQLNSAEVSLSDSNFSSDASTAIENLNLRADEIESCKDEIVRLNESGIASMNADGVITYNLPDTVAINSSKDLSSVVQAEIDAEKAKNADPDELLDLMNGSVADHQNDEVYAAAFADAMGPEDMANLAYMIDKDRQYQLENLPDYDPNDPDSDKGTRWERTNDAWLSAQATLSICFGTATSSSAWTPQHRSEYAEGLAALVTDEDQPYYMPLGFNLLLEGANRTAANTAELDGEAAQAGGVFNKYFLQDLGHAVEAHEKTCEGNPAWQSQRMKASPPEGSVGDWDPMAGILTAMGRQPDAALDFLAPPVDDRATEQTVEVDGTTWEWLKGRDWDSTSFEALSAAFAGASEHRQLTTGTEDERAAWITEQAVVDMAGRKDGLWTNTSRQNAAVVLANSMQEIDEAASERDNSDPPTLFVEGQPARWEEAHWGEIRLLMQETLKDDVALLTVSDAAGRFASQRLDSSLDELPADATYQDAYDQVSQTRYDDGCLLGYIQGAAEKGRGDDAADQDATNQMILSAFGKGLSFIPGPQSAVASQALSIAESYMLDAAGDALPSNSEQAKEDAKDMQSAVKVRLLVETYAKLDERGYLPDGAYVNPDGKPYGYAWMDYDNQDGSHIDEEELLSSPENIAKFNSWITDPDLRGVSSEARESTEGFANGREKGLE
ncbi:MULTISPECIES: DUF6571 family protein [unclassified Actinomyces]|uniref:DUF6571 family protein n=1 Tax=unclassified Actinomyces TaxID=2609248 RepID=UPI000D58DC8C|nr:MULTISPECIES: DUF6571 family protein [unclassified Actinomyces]RAX24185.1 hypothetical protein DRB07_01840 [Actinomyces sp. Z3]